MSTLTITIETDDSDAMVHDPQFEVANALTALATRIEEGRITPGDTFPVYDVMGARVGEIVWPK